MKKLTYLFVLMFSLVLISTSCEKDSVVPDEGITLDELVGNWNFESLEFGGEVYTTCDVDLNKIYNLVTFNMENVTTTSITLKTYCVDDDELPWQMTYSYTLEDNVLDLEGSVVFDILNADEFDGSTLELKLVNSTVGNIPITGVYTLTK